MVILIWLWALKCNLWKLKEKKEERKKKKTYGEIWFGKTSLNYIYPCGSGTTILAENWLSLYE